MNIRLLSGTLLLTLAAAVRAAPALETAPAQVETVEREQVFDGTVEAVNQTTVSAQTTGRVLQVLYDVDDYVEKGAVIVRLRDTEQRAQVEKAQAALNEARARYQQTKAEFARVKELFDKHLVSKSRYDQAKAERDAALARLQAAEAALDAAREQLERTRIRAPYSGIVTQRHVEVGEVVQPGTPVMTGVSLEKLRVRVAVPQRLINAIRKLRRARVIVQDEDGRTRSIPAERLTFFPYAQGKTNTFDVRVELPENVKGLFPGMFVKVAFVTGQDKRLVIPARAVVYRSEVTGVYVVDDQGRIHFRAIRPGRTTPDGKIVVLAGLKPGERVALDPIKAGALFKARRALREENGHER
ncbi:MAG TPA: efflux RND transporter periplasmic adaptor subunit [Chromatiales bacterium]|nr:efflux RND transporter periplasmic adaptor subunit [Chromatiales bacterium]